jgi:hypothetical protein
MKVDLKLLSPGEIKRARTCSRAQAGNEPTDFSPKHDPSNLMSFALCFIVGRHMSVATEASETMSAPDHSLRPLMRERFGSHHRG